MREIKFRVRNKNNGQVLYFTLKRIVGYPYFGDNLDWDNAEEYTGLKDKNGKEIYEGDIVTANSGYFKDRIIFTDGCFRFFNDRYDYLWHFNEAVEVIGNIYENPELLKGE